MILLIKFFVLPKINFGNFLFKTLTITPKTFITPSISQYKGAPGFPAQSFLPQTFFVYNEFIITWSQIRTYLEVSSVS